MITTHEYRGYAFTISQRNEESTFTVDFPDFSEIITSGDSLTSSFAHACEALDLHLASLQKLNLPVPLPRHRVLVQPTGK